MPISDQDRLSTLETKAKELTTANNSCVRAVSALDKRLSIVEKGKPVVPTVSGKVWEWTKKILGPPVKWLAPGFAAASGVIGLCLLTGVLMAPGCPGPGPVPPPPIPIPIPPLPPVPPPTPAPIPLQGFRVLMMYDKTSMTNAQSDVVYGRRVRDYLDAKCVKGEDGKTPDRWILPVGADVSAAPKWIGDTIQRHPGQGNWMVVSDGKTGYDGDLPANVDEALKILQKIGG